MFKSFVLNLYWMFVHALAHMVDFDGDGKATVNDLKVAAQKFEGLFPTIAADVAGWASLDIAGKLGAVISLFKAGFPEFAGLGDLATILAELGGFLAHHLSNPPAKIGPPPQA